MDRYNMIMDWCKPYTKKILLIIFHDSNFYTNRTSTKEMKVTVVFQHPTISTLSIRKPCDKVHLPKKTHEDTLYSIDLIEVETFLNSIISNDIYTLELAHSKHVYPEGYISSRIKFFGENSISQKSIINLINLIKKNVDLYSHGMEIVNLLYAYTSTLKLEKLLSSGSLLTDIDSLKNIDTPCYLKDLLFCIEYKSIVKNLSDISTYINFTLNSIHSDYDNLPLETPEEILEEIDNFLIELRMDYL